MNHSKIQTKQQQYSRPQSSSSSSSLHFHYQSGTEFTYQMTQSQVTPSRSSRSNFSLRQNGWKNETDLPGGNREELVSINEHSSEENQAVLVMAQQDSLGEEENSDFTFHDQQKPAITAQKSRFSHAHNSKETSSEEQYAPEGSNLDETFSYDASKLVKEHAFQSCLTPKPPKESKLTEEKERQKQRKIKEQQRLTFVKYEQHNAAGRRYPYRATREVPRLKYWEGERTDPVHQGYWKRISE